MVDARIGAGPGSVSLIVPTYEEVLNLPNLIERIEKVQTENKLEIELLIMDDDSGDGSGEVVAKLNKKWVHFICRTCDRGLSQSVVDGIKRATKDIIIVMDADLSHPPEKIPEIISKIDEGADFVIGSRYIDGGETAENWGLFRYLNSLVATWLARPFTRAKDPMSGFFAIRRSDFEAADFLNPVGYKIGLEIIVKAHSKNIAEVPIFFADREQGQSKLSFKEQLRYIQHIRRLFIYKYPDWSYILQFAVVGATGTVINLIVLTILKSLIGFTPRLAIAGGIVASVFANFLMNRRFTFSYAAQGAFLPQFVGFLSVSGVGMVMNYFVSIFILENVLPENMQYPQIAALFGIASGMVLNFLMSRHLVFRKSKNRS